MILSSRFSRGETLSDTGDRNEPPVHTRCEESPNSLEKTGAARGIRTPDPVITNDVLYRLSYCGFLLI
jgi:hypothetical protein